MRDFKVSNYYGSKQSMLFSIIQQFSGATAIRGYVVKIFGEIFSQEKEDTDSCEISQSAYTSAIITGVIKMAAGMTLTSLLIRVNRRTMYFVSAICSGFSLVMFSTILLISEKGQDLDVGAGDEFLSWFSLLAASFFVFSVNLGVQPLPILMSSELYPSTSRAFCKGVSRSITFLLTVISLKLFPLLQENLNLSGTFYLYFGVLACGLPLVMWILPETKDVPIAYINDIFVKKHKENKTDLISMQTSSLLN